MTGLIILAAGGSTRLGKPKQLLIYDQQTLITIAIEAALVSGCKPVVVVTGAYQKDVLKEISKQRVNITLNPSWQQGMGSSVKSGLLEVLRLQPQLEQVIIMLCDQPHLNKEILINLLQKKAETNKGIASAFYNNTNGAPVLFDKKYFAELFELNGQEGAKKILNKHKNDIVSVPFPLGSIDIDTMEDYEKLLNGQEKF